MAGERILLFLFFSFNFFWGVAVVLNYSPPPRENVHKVKEFKCFSALIVLIIQHPRGSRKKGEWNTLNLILLRSLSFSLFYKNQSRLKDTSLLTFCSLVGFLSGRANVVSWVWMWLGGLMGQMQWDRGWKTVSKEPLRISKMSMTSWSQPQFLHWKNLQWISAVELKRLSSGAMDAGVLVCVRAHSRDLKRKSEAGKEERGRA